MFDRTLMVSGGPSGGGSGGGPERDDDPLNGIWYSGAGSRVELRVKGSELHGRFHREGEARRLVGTVDPDTHRHNRALSFSVCWIDEGEESRYRSVSSYTGQFHAGDGEIQTIFLLVDETKLEKQYASTLIGYDNFSREAPAG